MSDTVATLTIGDQTFEFPVLSGSVGPDVIDIRSLYAKTGLFTYDPGFTSTASKRPEALFGPGAPRGLPVRFTRSEGALLWDEQGREYLDFVMALGAVGLGYGHPAVSRAAHAAVDAGVVGSLPPEAEERLAERLAGLVPAMERTRFLKTGAEAVAAAVRLARTHTGRDGLLRCGYHGWHDWCQAPGAPGVPGAVTALVDELPFNDSERARALIRLLGDFDALLMLLFKDDLARRNRTASFEARLEVANQLLIEAIKAQW